MRLVLVTLALALAAPAHAGKGRPVSFCLEDGLGGVVAGAKVQVWSEKLEIHAHRENIFETAEDGCAVVGALDWDGRAFEITPWVELVYSAEAAGFHPASGRYTVKKGKKKNRVTLMLEPKGPR